MTSQTEMGEPTMAEVEARISLQHRAEKAWSDAWDRARRTDERAGRPYNRHTYADAAHRASVKVKGVCLRAACKTHARSAP